MQPSSIKGKKRKEKVNDDEENECE